MVLQHEIYLQKVEEAQEEVFTSTLKHLEHGNASSLRQFGEMLEEFKEVVRFCITFVEHEAHLQRMPGRLRSLILL